MHALALIWRIALACIIVVTTVYGIQNYIMHRRPHVKDIWVINLDKDAQRFENIQARTRHIHDIVHRWSATNGKELTRELAYPDGVGYAMSRTGTQTEDTKGVMRNRGVIGCWLSHKRLLTHLASLDLPDHHGHLIVEDDVEFPADFLQPSDEWHQVYKRVPLDWDMVYFGLTQPRGTPAGDRILRAVSATPATEGNWGTHAYLIRHGSIRSKVLPALEYMTDAIDEQYNRKFGDWNVYVIEPAIIKLNDTLSQNSSLLKLNVGAAADAKISY